jgi:glucokinase
MKILSGDVGGTHTRLELFETEQAGLRSLAEEKYGNAGYRSFQELLQGFLAGQAGGQAVDAACLAVAGPVAEGRCRLTNLDWTLDARELGEHFGFPSSYLLNDFAAIPYGVDDLAEQDLTCLQPGKPRAQGVRAFVGAGTGLGQAISLPDGAGLRVLPSEAGHADFAPGSELQLRLVSRLRSSLGPVSNESLLSGRGLVNIYRGLFELGEGNQAPEVDITAEDAPARISEAARRGEELPARAIRVFFEMLGSYLGNVALQTLPFGGLYLAGGIVPKLMDLMDLDVLLRAYGNKAKMRDLLGEIPIQVILNEGVARLGAARYAVSRLAR